MGVQKFQKETAEKTRLTRKGSQPFLQKADIETMRKKMKAAIIGASREALHTIKKAQEHGLFILALDGDASAAGLAAADKGLVVDISDENAVTEALRVEKPDFLLTVRLEDISRPRGPSTMRWGFPESAGIWRSCVRINSNFTQS